MVQIKEGGEKEGARVPAFLMPNASVSTPGPHGQITGHRCPEELGEGCEVLKITPNFSFARFLDRCDEHKCLFVSKETQR